jgi:hypothetical protein
MRLLLAQNISAGGIKTLGAPEEILASGGDILSQKKP